MVFNPEQDYAPYPTAPTEYFGDGGGSEPWGTTITPEPPAGVQYATTSVSGSSWLDAIPGARAAYDFLRSKLSEFNVIGLQELPAYERLLQAIGPRINATGDATLSQLYQTAAQQTGSQRGAWSALDTKVQGVMKQLSSFGLGVIPLASAGVLAAAIIAVVGTMYVFFGAHARNEAAIRLLVDKSVERGVMSVDEAQRYLRGEGSGLGSLGMGLGLVAIVAAAIFFLPRRKVS